MGQERPSRADSKSSSPPLVAPRISRAWLAALTALPVLGVPIESASLKGLDSLLSMVQMPGGIPVATFAIGKPGAINAALFAGAILAQGDPKIKKAVDDYRAAQAKKVTEAKLP